METALPELVVLGYLVFCLCFLLKKERKDNSELHARNRYDQTAELELKQRPKIRTDRLCRAEPLQPDLTNSP
ncbi:hypothetical protein [Gaoshiqia sp. Z1-71]|uniref:hypothetical protein n=1 Tax=Gaoshiqia hydrogeniformans TaxID=3290090 RepID=UPI003BF8944D